MNYLIEQITNICSVQVNEICTCNNKHTLKLPCVHELLNNLTLESIIIPKEYLQLEKDILITTKNTQTPCVFETIEKTEVELNLRESVEKLYSMEGMLQKRNELAREIERYISREEYKWKKAQHLDNENPGKIRFSTNCDIPEFPKKRRGRPPKSIRPPKESESTTKKRRGRPPKSTRPPKESESTTETRQLKEAEKTKSKISKMDEVIIDN